MRVSTRAHTFGIWSHKLQTYKCLPRSPSLTRQNEDAYHTWILMNRGCSKPDTSESEHEDTNRIRLDPLLLDARCRNTIRQRFRIHTVNNNSNRHGKGRLNHLDMWRCCCCCLYALWKIAASLCSRLYWQAWTNTNYVYWGFEIGNRHDIARPGRSRLSPYLNASPSSNAFKVGHLVWRVEA